MEGSASTALFVETGERILVKLFGGRECNTLNELCFTSFIKNLPPTFDAFCFHSFGVYYAVQVW